MPRVRVCALIALLVASLARGEGEDPTWKKSFLLARGGDAYAKGRVADAEKLFGAVLAIDANDEVALIHLAAIHKRRGQFDKAVPLLSRGVAAHPKSYALQFELGAALLALGKAKDAATALDAAVELNPKMLDAQVNLGDALSLSGQRERAYLHYEAAVALDGASGWARRQAGACAFELKRPAEAVTHLLVAKATFPDDWNLQLVLGHAYAEQGNDAAALEAYARVSTLAPKSELGSYFSGVILERTGRLDEAQKKYEQAVALKPASAPAHMALGNLFRAQKRVDAARKHYEAALRAEPQNAWALSQLGFLELELDHPVKAQQLLTRALVFSPTDADIGDGLGDAFQAQHKPTEAKKAYEAVLKRHPTNLSALVKSADMYRLLGQLPEAVTRYGDAARLHPRNVWALISWGDSLRMVGRHPEARLQYLKALELEPQSPWASRQLGFVSFELGDLTEASARLTPLATGDCKEPDVLLVVGHLALKRKAYDEALALYERARQLRPQHAPTFLYLADAHQHRDAFAEAQAAVAQALALDDKFVDAYILQGDVLRRSAQALGPTEAATASELRKKARASYERALTLSADHTWVRHQLGFLAWELGDDETAEALLSKLRPEFATEGELVLTLGHLATKRKAYAQAQQAYLDASALMPDDVRPWVFAGRTSLALERYAEAETLFARGVKVAPESGWAHLERGYGQRLRRDWPGALESARKATRFDPKNPEAWLFLGRLAQERRDSEAAVAAYEKASELAPLSAVADRALASALTNRGTADDLLRGELLLKRPLEQLGDVGYTHAVAGYLMVKLAKTGEFALPAPQAPETRENRKKRWAELGAFELTRALELAPGDRAMRLAAAVSFFELGRFAEARAAAQVLVEGGNRACPTDEWTWQWELKAPAKSAAPVPTPEEAAAEEDAQLRSEAYLLLGDLFTHDEAQPQARLAYFCALRWLPSRADAHQRLAASYEGIAQLKMAEEHFVAALTIDPASKAAQQGLERLRKEGGFPLGPIRASGTTSFISEFVPGEVQARQAQVLGFTAPQLQKTLLTTPRTLALEADGSWQKESWRSKLRLGLGYQFAWGFNSFLNDQLAFEDRRAHRVEVLAAGRYGEFEDRRYELSWNAAYRLSLANATTRGEVRNGVYAQARLLRVDWGTADAELGYELGLYTPSAGASVLDTTGHAGVLGFRVSPLLRRWQVDLTVGYRGQLVGLYPSRRTIWLHELTADGRKLWQHVFVGGDFRGGVSSDVRPMGGALNVTTGSVTLRGNMGYAWSGYSRAFGRAGISLVPGLPTWNSVLLGAQAEHRFVFRGVGDSDQGISAALSYDARITYGLGRVEHLVTALVTLGR